MVSNIAVPDSCNRYNRPVATGDVLHKFIGVQDQVGSKPVCFHLDLIEFANNNPSRSYQVNHENNSAYAHNTNLDVSRDAYLADEVLKKLVVFEKPCDARQRKQPIESEKLVEFDEFDGHDVALIGGFVI